MAGNVLAVGSMSGVVMLQMERMPMLWFFRNVGWKALVGWMVGLAVMVVGALCF